MKASHGRAAPEATGERSDSTGGAGGPIFVVGAPRSGTSLLYQLLRLHPSLAWITPVTNRCLARDPWHGEGRGRGRYFFERPEMAALIEALVQRLPRRLTPPRWRGPHDGSLSARGLPETSEGYQIWRSYLPETPHHRLTEADVTDEAADYFRQMARWHLGHFGRPRLLCKRPRHVLRLRYFAAVFPQAHFVHLVRDGRAVAASMLGRRRGARGAASWWGLKPPGWEDAQQRPPVVQCGWTWKTCCATAAHDAEAAGLTPARYHAVRYEALTEEPRQTLHALRAALGLPDAPAFRRALRSHYAALENRNARWPARLTAEQRTALLAEIGEALPRWGYPTDPA